MPTREEMRSLAGEIVGSYVDRVATIAELRETVKLDMRELRMHLQELRDSRIATGEEIRTDLARGTAHLEHEVGAMLNSFSRVRTAMSKELRADLASNATDCKREVGAMLNGFGQARATVSKKMSAELARGVADRKRKVGAMIRGFNAKLKEIRSELAGGREEWEILTATMQAHRGGLAVEAKPSVEEAAEITPGTAALSDRVFEYLANHPDGTKMTKLEKEFGLARIQMAKVVRSLINENKVKKQELLYFAI